MNWSRNSKIILLFGILLSIIVFGYNYLYQGHQKIDDREAVYEGTAKNFQSEYLNSPQKFNNKVIIIEGKVVNTLEGGITVENSFFYQLAPSQDSPTKNELIKIKARLIGYDDLLEEFKLDQGIIIKE